MQCTDFVFYVAFILTAVYGDWPILNDTKVILVGLFPDENDTTWKTSVSIHSRAMFQAAMILAHRSNLTVSGNFIGWQTFQTGGHPINSMEIICSVASTSNLVGIVGPAFSREAHILGLFGSAVGIPVISYAATDPELQDRSNYQTFYRTAPADNEAINSIVHIFYKYNWRSCTIIHQNDAFGIGGARLFSRIFPQNGIFVDKVIQFSINNLSFHGKLKNLLSNSVSRIIILWADFIHTMNVIQTAIDNDVLGPQFTWILSTTVQTEHFTTDFLERLAGMLVIEPTTANTVNAPINHTLLQAAYQIWQEYEPETLPKIDNIDPYALFAFDAAWSIILALAHVCHRSFQSNDTCVQLTGPTFCFDRMLQNSTLLNEFIRSNTFLGVSGQVNFDRTTTNRLDENYYQMKNYQQFWNKLRLVNVLSYSYDYNWTSLPDNHFIVWPDQTSDTPDDKSKLQGVRLNIGLPEIVPYAFKVTKYDGKDSNKTKLVGFMIDLLNALQISIGFNATLKLLPSNMTYNQMIEMLPDSEYDLLVGDFTITSGRKEIVDFSNAIFENSIRIMTRASVGTEIDFFSYLKPFSQSLWILILFTSIVAGFLVCLVERNENHQMNSRPIVNALGMSLWYSFGVLLGYGVDFHAQTPAGRILTIGLYVMSLIFVATYTANLVSEISISQPKYIVSGIDDLKYAKVPAEKIGVLVDSALEGYYLREISHGVRNFYELLKPSLQFEKLVDGSVDIVLVDSALADYMTKNVYCNLTVLHPEFDKSVFGLVYRKGWIYSQELDIAILKLYESGMIERLRRQWFHNQNCEKFAKNESEIKLESLSGLFLTFAIISIIALLVTIITNWSVINKVFSKLNNALRDILHRIQS